MRTSRTIRDRRYLEVYALLWLTRDCETRLTEFLVSNGISPDDVQRGMHLTVYYARRHLPGLSPVQKRVAISADIAETRFMVFAPGGENPRPKYDPSRLSVGVRLTKRNSAIGDIQALRESVYRFETSDVIGSRKRTTAWANCFGARHYQPHIKLLRPGNGLQRDLTTIGKSFRASLNTIDFGKYEVVIRYPNIHRNTSEPDGR